MKRTRCVCRGDRSDSAKARGYGCLSLVWNIGNILGPVIGGIFARPHKSRWLSVPMIMSIRINAGRISSQRSLSSEVATPISYHVSSRAYALRWDLYWVFSFYRYDIFISP